jgi:hypothetical protein
MIARKFILRLLAAIVLGTAFCLGVAALFRPSPTAAEDAAPGRMPAASAQAPSTLRVTNECGFKVWIAQQGLPEGEALTPLTEDSHVDFPISPAGVAGARLWAKAECDDAGQGCKVGQSSAPCPPNGCAPPVDSKLEATFPCLLGDASACTKNPSNGKPLTNVLWWNASAVDGFTLPFAVRVSGVEAGACPPADCSKLLLRDCPTDDDLSDDGKNTAYKSQDEMVKTPDSDSGKRFAADVSGTPSGCFAPYMKLGYPGHGGDGLNAPAGPVEKMYACPTPPISAEACRTGPVTRTKYVELVHRACDETVYSYAYDDAIGLRGCPGQALLELVYCPKGGTR